MFKAQVLAEPSFIGREKEIRELQTYLNSAIQGKGKTVFISGEAGNGKTRLTREFLGLAIKQGVAVMAGWCLSDSQAPFFPFIEAFNSYYEPQTEIEQSIGLQEHQLNLEVPSQIVGQEREVASWLAGPKPGVKSGKTEMLSPEVWKDQALAAVAETVHTIARQAPMILVIEDLHWADSASLALLHYLSRVVKDSDKVLLLATFRSEDLTTDAEGHPHPLAETLRMMRREDLFAEIKLPSLDVASVSKLVESMIGSCMQQEFTDKLVVQSGGSPLFIVESLRMINENGGLVRDGACFRLDVDKVSIPSKVKDIILRRLSSLKREQRRVLDAAAVIGVTFDLGLLSSVLGQDSLLVVEALGTIAQSTSLLVCEGEAFRFDHAKSREALYEEIPLPIKKSYHARIAEKLETSYEGSTLPLSDIAYHYAQAGNKEKAVKYALAAGKDELEKYSNTQAIRHFQYVLAILPDGEADEIKAAMEGLGDAYSANSNHNEAIRTFDKLAELATGTLKLRAIRKAMDVAYRQGSNPDLLLDYAKRAEELGINDRLEMARIIDNRGKAWGWSGRGDWKMDLADYNTALKVFEEENSLADVAEALWRSGSLTALTNFKLGFSRTMRSIAIFKELGDVRNEVKTTTWFANILANTCVRNLKARQELKKVLSIGEKLGLFPEICGAHLSLGLMDEQEGKETEALLHYSKALEFCQKAEVEWMKWVIYSNFLRLYSSRGELRRAEEYFKKIKNLPLELLSNVNVRYVYNVSRGVYFAAKNQWNETQQAFDEAFKELKKFKNPKIEYGVRASYSWALKRQNRIEEANSQIAAIRALISSIEEIASHTTVQLSIMVPRKVVVGEEFTMRLDLATIGRQSSNIVNVEGIALPEFVFIDLPPFCKLQNNAILFTGKSVGPLELETIKLKIKATKRGCFSLNPKVRYFDELGYNRISSDEPIIIFAETAQPNYEVLPARVPTGTLDLDKLLLGGIPERYAIVLVSPSFEERQRIISNFVEVGIDGSQTLFFFTNEPRNAKNLAEENPSHLFLFVFNPKADLVIKDLPNVYKLKGVENLTNIDIAVAKASKQIKVTDPTPRRACVDIVSDVLLQHHAVTARKWLAGLIQELKSKGFTILATVNPQIHPFEEAQAIQSLFDGEIQIAEKETSEDTKHVLSVRKLLNQKYREEEIVLTRDY
jgi:tetratricopeptide (TPR) repeat protein/KaiC/GvpD/RAD55 family RecA-like ATPase